MRDTRGEDYAETPARQGDGALEAGAQRAGALPLEPAPPRPRPHPRRRLRHRPQPRDAAAPAPSGVDHNETSIAIARERGLTALTTDGVGDLRPAGPRVVRRDAGRATSSSTCRPSRASRSMRVLRALPRARADGCSSSARRSAGYASDPTHVRWTTGEDLMDLSRDLGPASPQQWTELPAAAGHRQGLHLQRVQRGGDQAGLDRLGVRAGSRAPAGRSRSRPRRRASRSSRCRPTRAGRDGPAPARARRSPTRARG